MKELSVEVKSASQVVGTASYQEFDTLDEAKSTLGEAVALSLLNVQVKTTAANKVRQQSVKPPKSYFRDQALAQLIDTAEGMAQLKAVQGDSAARTALIDKIQAELESQWKPLVKTAVASEE